MMQSMMRRQPMNGWYSFTSKGLERAQWEDGQSSQVDIQQPPQIRRGALQFRLTVDTHWFGVFVRSKNYYDPCWDEFMPAAAHLAIGAGWTMPPKTERRGSEKKWPALACLEVGYRFSVCIRTGGFHRYDGTVISVRLGAYVWSWHKGIRRVEAA